jgi:hypothetical protein
VAALAGCALGAVAERRDWAHRPPRWAAAIPALIVFLALVDERAAGVSLAPYLLGLTLGTLAIGVAPFLVYLWAGRVLTRYPVLLAIISVVSLVPLYLVLFFVALYTVGWVECAPGASDCPL